MKHIIFGKEINSRVVILWLICTFSAIVVAWLFRDQLRNVSAYERIKIDSPRILDGSIPSQNAQDTMNSANVRFSREKNWIKRDLNPAEYPFKAPEFLDYLDSIATESPTPIVCAVRLGDKQIMGVTYPKRLEEVVDIALRVMKKRQSNK